MTLRDWFAGCALQGIMAQPKGDVVAGLTCADRLTAKAYALADAMLKARERPSAGAAA